MQRFFKIILAVILFAVFLSCNEKTGSTVEGIQIAFLADVHLQDIYGDFHDSDFKGIQIPGSSDFVLARTMQAQLNSTRLYNENYFAFIAALNDVVKRGINYVVLPGDFSDDGQPINVRGLKSILNAYSEKYGIRFITTTGNHDPVRPFSVDAGKTDFLGEGGRPQPIMSKAGMYVPKKQEHLQPIITQDIRTMGYTEIVSTLGNLGFFPQQSDIYWETPFSSYTYDEYHFDQAFKQSALENRNYAIPPYNTTIPDVSYLVETEKDLWFLAIDANVYIPKAHAATNAADPNAYEGSSLGYGNVLTHKKHLIAWVKKVTKEADKRGKTLIVFSHYPMIEFNDDASEHIKNLLGEGKMQLHRVPEEHVTRTFADAGVQLHFGGHMHINDTGIRNFENGTSLVNVQIPSLAAYIPAYKILTIHGQKKMEVETVILDSVPGFKNLFPLYQIEHDYLQSIGSETIWDEAILSAKSYHEFTNFHLKELVRLNFLKNDWPVEFRDFMLNASGNDLLKFVNSTEIADSIETSNFGAWTGMDMIFDFYRLRSADKLAIADIGINRIKQYQLVIERVIKEKQQTEDLDNRIKRDFKEFALILHHFLNGAPADHFMIDLEKGDIISVTEPR